MNEGMCLQVVLSCPEQMCPRVQEREASLGHREGAAHAQQSRLLNVSLSPTPSLAAWCTVGRD